MVLCRACARWLVVAAAGQKKWPRRRAGHNTKLHALICSWGDEECLTYMKVVLCLVSTDDNIPPNFGLTFSHVGVNWVILGGFVVLQVIVLGSMPMAYYQHFLSFLSSSSLFALFTSVSRSSVVRTGRFEKLNLINIDLA